MRTVGELLDYLNIRIDDIAEKVLNPDRAPLIRETELHIRRELIRVREFLEGAGTESKK